MLSFAWVQTLGLWGAGLFTDQTAAVCGNAMNDYSGSLALQVTGLRVPRPLAAAAAAAGQGQGQAGRTARRRRGTRPAAAVVAGVCRDRRRLRRGRALHGHDPVRRAGGGGVHGADLAYYVAVVVAVAVYGLLRRVAGPGGPAREPSSALG
ncbi:hypothetical protein [Streptomyces sp. MOE7]|uniref:hypothetical protein n=1 Tax=Streptomyces sp. MOE7 TaxID=1961713 RepID=UPI000A07F1EB|nr:hypothetical protein STRMOE7_00970 [Streptomyces sp. MOE7]